MSVRRTLTLVAMAVVTIACTAGYLAVSAEQSAFPGPPTEGRIVAVDTDDGLVTVDPETGSTSEPVPDLAPLRLVDVGPHRETAFAVFEGDNRIHAVHVASGRTRTVAPGDAGAVGPLAFPQLARTIERPEVEQLAVPSDSDELSLHVVNLTTGVAEVLRPIGDGADLHGIGALTWGFDNVLYGVTDGGRRLFRLDTGKADTLDAATESSPLAGDGRWVDLTWSGDGLIGVMDRDGRSELVRIDPRSFESHPLDGADAPGSIVGLDSEHDGARLLAVTAEEQLWIRDPGGQWRHVADGIRAARW